MTCGSVKHELVKTKNTLFGNKTAGGLQILQAVNILFASNSRETVRLCLWQNCDECLTDSLDDIENVMLNVLFDSLSYYLLALHM